MSEEKNKERLLFIVSYDWRDIFRTNKKEYFEKLQRDQLCPEVNDFFFFSWEKNTYYKCEGKWCTAHKKTYGLEKVRPLLNLWAIFFIPYTAYKHSVRPDAWVVYDFGMVPAMWLASKLFGGVLIMYVNNNPQDCSLTRKFGKIKQMYSKLVECIGVHFVKHFFTLNETMLNHLMQLDVSRENISLYTVNTIERDSEYILKAEKGAFRKKYNIPEDTKILLSVARLEAEKNYPLLLDLFSTLSSEYVLFCLGAGSLMESLHEQAKKLHIENRVYFVGNVEREEIWNYYADADVFVLLSKAEALGIVFWEAMYMGVPAIGSDVEGIIESLGVHGERGKIWKESDTQSGFTKVVSFCVTPSTERDTILIQAKEFVEDKIKNRATLNDFLDSLDKKK
jgi:glycosyltransferase involved in cell wall biosynthesis